MWVRASLVGVQQPARGRRTCCLTTTHHNLRFASRKLRQRGTDAASVQ